MALTLSQLMKQIDAGDLALPEFQRDYKWPVDYRVELIRSILRDWPIGTFLLLEQTKPKALLMARAIERAPKCKTKPRYLILDGQQRMTALYHAMRGIGGYVFYVDLGLIWDQSGVSDECVDALSDRDFKSRFGKSVDERAANRVATLEELTSTGSFNTWLSYIPDRERLEFADLKDDYLERLEGYTIASEIVSSDLPIDAIAKIFERTNRSVTPLDAFDLMVAILFPHNKFNLRNAWRDARTSHPLLEEYDIPGIEVLKVIALREHLRQQALLQRGKLARLTVSGVRQSDILAVKPTQVIAEWPDAVAAYAAALKFVVSECGVIRKRVIPQLTMQLPLADVFYGRKRKPAAALCKKLQRWYWATVFRRLYARGANTRAVTDARLLRTWASDGIEPEHVSDFSVGPDDFMEVDEGNEIVISGIACLLARLGARDWAKYEHGDGTLQTLDRSIALSIHHVFPRDVVRNRERKWRFIEDIPANQVLINAGLNGSIRNQSPSTAVKSTKVDSSAISTQIGDLASLKKDDYETFVAARATELARRVNHAVAHGA